MARKPEFDEMTLITEESTINEPQNMQNMAKKEEYLQELHRQINGSHNNQDGEFQFYPGNNKHSNTQKTNKSNKNTIGNSGNNGIAASSSQAYPGDGGIGIKQDSVMTVTIEGTVNNAPLEQEASVMDQLDQSQVSFLAKKGNYCVQADRLI